jgi:hypothetical protein
VMNERLGELDMNKLPDLGKKSVVSRSRAPEKQKKRGRKLSFVK